MKYAYVRPGKTNLPRDLIQTNEIPDLRLNDCPEDSSEPLLMTQ